MVKLDAFKDGDRISISEGSFEHLLNCLDNQKFVHNINADSLTCDYRRVQKETQAAIDDFNRQCRALLHDSESDDSQEFMYAGCAKDTETGVLYGPAVDITDYKNRK